MSELFRLARKNPDLRYINPENGRSHALPDLTFDLETGPGSKSLAFLYLDNSPSGIGVFWSFMRSNHALALLSPGLSTGFKRQLESAYKPYFIFDPEREEIENYGNPADRENLFTRIDEEESSADIHPKIKIMLSTSGTTGSPNFVKLSEENLLENARSIIDYLPIRPDDVVPLNLPVYYSYGLSILTTNSIAGGRIVCTREDILSKKFWEEWKAYGYSTFAGVPYVYEMLERIGFTKKSYPSLRYLTQAGGKLNSTLVTLFGEYARKNGIRFFVMYGQTEASARMSYLDPDMVLEKPGSIGKPIKNGTFQIDDETSELHYRGPNVFGGYARKREDLSEYDDSNDLATGDLARRDDEGYYYIIGRAKRFVKLFGSRVNLDEVEARLKDTFEGQTFACKGINDEYLLVVYEKNHLEESEVKDYLKKKLGLHPSTLILKQVDKMPLTQNGKINYGQLTA